MNMSYRSMQLASNKGKELCVKCKSRGYNTQSAVQLKVLCYNCKGTGHIDWIDRMTGNPVPGPPEEHIRHRIMLDNIEVLMYNIKTILAENGINAHVAIKEISSCDRYGIPLSKRLKNYR